MQTIDLCLSSPSRESLVGDLLAAGLLVERTALLSNPPHAVLTPVEGVNLDHIGELVDQPATHDTSSFPPVELTPATFLPGYRANLRLTGEQAAPRAEAFVGATHAGGTSVIPTAEVPAAQRLRWGDAGFPWAPEELPTPPPEAPAPTVAQRRAQLLARLAERRYQAETGGITLDGVPIRTDRESSAMLSAAINFCNLESQAVVRWKAADGQFYELGETALRQIALEVGRHVQLCFAREAELAEALAAAPDRAALDALAPAIEAFQLPTPH